MRRQLAMLGVCFGGKGRQIKSRWGEGILRIRLNDRCMAHTEQQSEQATGYTDHLQLRTTLRKFLMKVKERPGMMEVKGVVYFIPCAECSATYIGETGRTLKVHMVEHRRAVENKDHKNGIAMHVQNTAYTINRQEARNLVREDNWGRR